MASDLISRKALEDDLGKVWGIPADWDGGMDEKCETAFTVIGNQPTVDAVEVVRCKDCKHYEETYPGYGYCYHWDYEDGSSPNAVESDDFCSSGAKMDGGDKA